MHNACGMAGQKKLAEFAAFLVILLCLVSERNLSEGNTLSVTYIRNTLNSLSVFIKLKGNINMS